MTAAAPVTLHASCVSWQAHGVLLSGPSGIGKSDLALRLIEAGALLVADDVVALRRTGTQLAAYPCALSGLIELRGQGIYRMDCLPHAEIALFVRLGTGVVERLPERHAVHRLLDVELPVIDLDPRLPAAVSRIRLALFGTRVH